MASEANSRLMNYYEALDVPRDAPEEVIKATLARLIASAQQKLNNPMTMQGARQILNEIAPAIQKYLLSGKSDRAEYDRDLATEEQRLLRGNEPADHEGLDDILRTPFFFDPIDGYDTEKPALSLRQIAMKLDEEWASACNWITNTRDDFHPFISFLEHIAGRQRLAGQLEKIIQSARGIGGPKLDTNIAIEHCIDILNPQAERPMVSIENSSFDGRIFYAGDFVPDLPAEFKLMLRHDGMRGCVSGRVESQTAWITFPGGQKVAHFTLMPGGTDPAICLSQVNIPLQCQLLQLQRNCEHTAELIIYLDNYEPSLTWRLPVQINILPLPPRVVFTPLASKDYPAWAGIIRRGSATSVVVTPNNAGDNDLVPLVGRITSRDPGASAQPARFHNGEPITLHIDTRNRPFGKEYGVVFDVNYGGIPGAKGPTALYVQGKILPTPWQSFKREKGMSERIIMALVGGFLGFILFGASGAVLSAHLGIAWIFFFALPLVLPFVTRRSAETIIAHIQRSEQHTVYLENLPTWGLLGIPIGVGLLLDLLCLFFMDAATSFLLVGLVGLAVGIAFSFIVDKARAAKAGQPLAPVM